MQMDGRTDKHDEGNNRFSQFCERTERARKVNFDTNKNNKHALPL